MKSTIKTFWVNYGAYQNISERRKTKTYRNKTTQNETNRSKTKQQVKFNFNKKLIQYTIDFI